MQLRHVPLRPERDAVTRPSADESMGWEAGFAIGGVAACWKRVARSV